MKSAEIDAVAREQAHADGARRVRIRLQAAAEADRRLKVQRAAAAQEDGGGNVDCAMLAEVAIGAAAPPVSDIIGVGDRAHHMALKLGHVTVAPRQAPVGRPVPLPRLPPSSRAECQRRCGTAGFCDPSSDLGCGGEYCASRYEPL